MTKKIPKARLGQHFVGGKQLHAESRRVDIVFGRGLATNNLELTNLPKTKAVKKRENNTMFTLSMKNYIP